jgi:hypothetical protein
MIKGINKTTLPKTYAIVIRKCGTINIPTTFIRYITVYIINVTHMILAAILFAATSLLTKTSFFTDILPAP